MNRRVLLDRWEEVDPLFTAALDLPREERAAYVARRCAGDVRLRDAVLALLESSDTTGEFLDNPAVLRLVPGSDGEAEHDDACGEQLGVYRVIRQIGRGGSSSVYLAERTTGDFEHSVAIKVLRRGLDTADVLERFRAERQILASLNHPNVARLLDGGATADGRPYLVMELVDGQPIHEYCDERRLTAVERLRLLVAVGRAVEYAHRNLVVHRDLKPGNVLVTRDGVVKLLDFGIAKLLDPSSAVDGTPQTRSGLRPMTPQYASPEQVLGGVITTASDVYQLGLLLYELLTGRRPHGDPASGGGRLLEERITREAPVAPSASVLRGAAGEGTSTERNEWIASRRRTEPRKLARVLRGDLDCIILKALRKEPERRYASVAELVEDIERYLGGRPVLAQPDRWSYRMRKHLRRHPAAAAATLIMLLAAGLYMSALQRHARELRDYAELLERGRNIALSESQRAHLAASTAQQVTDLLADLFTGVAPGQPATKPLGARQLLDLGVERAEQLRGTPDVQAALLSAIARALAAVGAGDEALVHARRALDLQRSQHGDQHPSVAQSLVQLAALTPDGAERERLVREGSAIRQRLVTGGLAVAINDAGVMIGTLFDSSEHYRTAVRWRLLSDGTISPPEELFTAGSAPITEATGLNSSGVVVGYSEFRVRWSRRALIHAGAMQTLPLPDSALSSWALAINDAGVAVGMVEFRVGSDLVRRGVVWTDPLNADGQPIQLSPLPGDLHSSAHWIDEDGNAGGWSETERGRAAVIWRARPDGTFSDAQPLGEIHPYGMMSGEWFVGASQEQAVLLRDGQFTTLRALPKHSGAIARAISRSPEGVPARIAGVSMAGRDGEHVPVLWTVDAAGRVSAPSELRPPQGYRRAAALDINPLGWKVGVAYGLDRRMVPALWRPRPRGGGFDAILLPLFALPDSPSEASGDGPP